MTDLRQGIEDLRHTSLTHKIVVINIDDLHASLRWLITEGYTTRREHKLAIWQVRRGSFQPLFKIYVDTTRTCPRGQYVMMDEPEFSIRPFIVDYNWAFDDVFHSMPTMRLFYPSIYL